MFDEFEVLEKRVANGKVDSDIYEHLRHIMQFCPNITFILAGTRRTDYLSPDYRKMFSNMALTQEVSFMDAADARDLIQLPVAGQVTIENGAIDELMRATHNHPYLLQLLCNHLIVEMNHKAKSNIISLENVNDAIEHFVEHGEFTNLWEETTDTEKMIFSALSKIIKPENSYSSMSEISRSLNLPNERISEALDGLLRHHLVERLTVQESDEKDIFVKPTIDLFYRWIQRNYSQYEVLN